MKISATLNAKAHVIAHIDSDNFFIRQINPNKIYLPGGKIRFYAGRQGLGLKTHEPWYAAARQLLGISNIDVYTADYIDQFVIWHRPVVQAMVAQLEQVTGTSWARALVRTPHFSEYVLYGVFAERVLGLNRAGLAKETHPLALWAGPHKQDEDPHLYTESLLPEHLVLNIQSTLSVSTEERRRIFQCAVDYAARQDSRNRGSPNKQIAE